MQAAYDNIVGSTFNVTQACHAGPEREQGQGRQCADLSGTGAHRP